MHQFFPEFCYGTEQYTLALARGLQALGHDVTVLTGHPHPGADFGSAFTRYRHENVTVLSLRECLSRRSSFGDSFLREDLVPIYGELLAELRPDVVHATHLIHLTGSFLRAAARAGIPLVATLTDFWGLCWTGQLVTSRGRRSCEGPAKDGANCVADFVESRGAPKAPPFLGALLRTLRGPARTALAPDLDAIASRAARLRACYELADRWIAPSQYLLDTFVRNGFARERFRRIPYAVEPPAPAERQALDARYAPERAPGAPLRFGYMGQIAAHKGVLELVRAFRAADLPRATLAIHGNPEQSAAYAREIRAAIAGDERIALRGGYEPADFYRRLSEIDVLVVPSVWHENAPLVLLGALAARTAIVAPRAKGMLEYLPGDSDLVYPLGDEAALRACLERAARDRGRLGARAHEPAPYQFGPLDVARATLGVYDEILAERRATHAAAPPDRLDFALAPLRDDEALDPEGIAAVLGRAGARGFELRVPPDGRARVRAPGLRLRRHGHPYYSLWSRRDRTIALDRHPAFAKASQIEVVARRNRGGATLLRYEYELPDGGCARGELRLEFPKHEWGRLTIPLATARRAHRIRRLEWVPATHNGRAPLKLDLLSIRFEGPPDRGR